MKNKLLENISFVIIAVTLVLVAIFNKSSIMMLYIAGVGCLLYGLLASLLKNRYGAMIMGGGISLLITMFIYTNKILDKVDSLTFFVSLTLTLISIISYVFMIMNEKIIKNKYNMEVEAKVVDL